MRLIWIILFFAQLSSISAQNEDLFHGNGTVSFVSNAPVETIEATSEELKGILDLEKNTFAFSFPVSSFRGFNSPLQKDHFNEHYLETAIFPKSTFVGKLIGLENCENDCNTEIIAKGKFTIHGVTQVVSIPVSIKKTPSEISAFSKFTVVLTDYDIEIPLILEAKIAPIIQVHVRIKFAKKDD